MRVSDTGSFISQPLGTGVNLGGGFVKCAGVSHIWSQQVCISLCITVHLSVYLGSNPLQRWRWLCQRPQKLLRNRLPPPRSDSPIWKWKTAEKLPELFWVELQVNSVPFSCHGCCLFTLCQLCWAAHQQAASSWTFAKVCPSVLSTNSYYQFWLPVIS